MKQEDKPIHRTFQDSTESTLNVQTIMFIKNYKVQTRI